MAGRAVLGEQAASCPGLVSWNVMKCPQGLSRLCELASHPFSRPLVINLQTSLEHYDVSGLSSLLIQPTIPLIPMTTPIHFCSGLHLYVQPRPLGGAQAGISTNLPEISAWKPLGHLCFHGEASSEPPAEMGLIHLPSYRAPRS